MKTWWEVIKHQGILLQWRVKLLQNREIAAVVIHRRLFQLALARVVFGQMIHLDILAIGSTDLRHAVAGDHQLAQFTP